MQGYIDDIADDINALRRMKRSLKSDQATFAQSFFKKFHWEQLTKIIANRKEDELDYLLKMFNSNKPLDELTYKELRELGKKHQIIDWYCLNRVELIIALKEEKHV